MTPDDFDGCRRTLESGSRSFAAAARLLPRRVRRPATVLYAFCRAADDAVDEHGDADAAVAALQARLAGCYADGGAPRPNAVDHAFADMVVHHALPRSLPEALLDGFAWDAQGRRYQTLDALTDYAMRVAGSVGVMMAVLMGVRDRAALAAACELGCAMQLTNIARDVGEDARRGRLYLPLDWLHEVGLDAETFLAQPAYSPALGGLVRRLLTAARQHYRRGSAGIGSLPLSCRPAIRAAALLYAGIGDEIERRGCDTVSARVVMPRRRKLAVLPRLLLPRRRLPAGYGFAAAVPLLVAVPLVASVPKKPLWQHLDDRIAWTADLFARLEQQRGAPAR